MVFEKKYIYMIHTLVSVCVILALSKSPQENRKRFYIKRWYKNAINLNSPGSTRGVIYKENLMCWRSHTDFFIFFSVMPLDLFSGLNWVGAGLLVKWVSLHSTLDRVEGVCR